MGAPVALLVEHRTQHRINRAPHAMMALHKMQQHVVTKATCDHDKVSSAAWNGTTSMVATDKRAAGNIYLLHVFVMDNFDFMKDS